MIEVQRDQRCITLFAMSVVRTVKYLLNLAETNLYIVVDVLKLKVADLEIEMTEVEGETAMIEVAEEEMTEVVEIETDRCIL
jgi:hypothetical protein